MTYARTLHLPGSPGERRAASVTVAALALRASEHSTVDPLVEARTVLAALGLDGDAGRPVSGALASGNAWRQGNR